MIKVNTPLHTGGATINSGSVISIEATFKPLEWDPDKVDGEGDPDPGIKEYKVEVGLILRKNYTSFKSDPKMVINQIDEFAVNKTFPITKEEHAALDGAAVHVLVMDWINGILGGSYCELIDSHTGVAPV